MINKIISFLKNHYYLATALLMFLSVPSYDVVFLKGFPFFAWFAYIPLMVFIRDKNFKDIYYYTFLTALIGNVLCYNWIGDFGASVPGGSVILLILLMPLLAMYLSLKFFIAEFISRKYEYLRLIIFPAVWVIIDGMQSIGHLAFPWPSMAYSQYPLTWFIQSAAVIGAQGITFLIIIFNYSISEIVFTYYKNGISLKDLLKTAEAKKIYILSAVLIFISLFGFINIPSDKTPPKRDIRISLVQSCISPWDNWRANKFDYLEELKDYTIRAVTDNPDLVVWSESATLEPISYYYDSAMLNRFTTELLDFVRSINIPLISGEIGLVEDYTGAYPRRYPLNNAVYINSKGEVIGSYSKIHLVPFGEWFPYEKWFPFVKQVQADFGGSDFVPGDEPKLFSISQYKFSILICYEGIFQRLCREYKKMGAMFFINITNDGWSHAYSGHMQHFAASIFRAVENGMWYVRAGNTGYSTIIDPYGRIKYSIPILKKGYVTGDLDLSLNRATIYSHVGDIILYASLVFIIVLLILIFFKSQKVILNRVKKLRVDIGKKE